ncbi:RluA family pseudouridine synthase [Hymenobacter latericus]|uniref:RluA family pseudouridine synthase n=1 Tax=Hymenobacter sp. YIM 151858-1 TaxID=2987688 RepID=UPI002225CB3E|nr:RluA family pseudouridine synthase [Hymenobacter sp. YIM 151858-1]UYZ59155.1 RluA family pseudouridine synthase [Hymenobacter sp. YIM 151858-1]
MNRPAIWSEQKEILFEDNHLLVLNKTAGTLVQGDETGDEPLSSKAAEYLRLKYKKPGNAFVGVCHRLDRPVTGVVVLAKTSKALSRLNEMFRDNHMHKTYWALVGKAPQQSEGTLVHWLVKDPMRNVTKAYPQKHQQGQRAELHYKVLAQVGHRYLIEVNPITGRPHQIRVQLATGLGTPITGDVKYGAMAPLPDLSIALHARRLRFKHPVTQQEMDVTAPLPDAEVWNPVRELELA